METKPGSQYPFRFPLYDPFQEVGKFAGGRVCQITSSDPLSVVGLTLEKGNERWMWIVNLSATLQRVQIEGIDMPVQLHRYEIKDGVNAISRWKYPRKNGDRILILEPQTIAVVVAR